MNVLGVVAGALVIGVLLGVLFHIYYPSIRISSQLSLLFAFLGLLIAMGLRAVWQAILRRPR